MKEKILDFFRYNVKFALMNYWSIAKLAARRYFNWNYWNDEPRQYALVRFDFDSIPEDYRAGYQLIFAPDRCYIYLGEIPNMAGHCIIMDHQGKHYVGYHIENFVELSEEPDEDGMDDTDKYPPVGFLR